MADDKSRGLFQIRVIDLDTDGIVYAEEVVAEGESDALFQSDVKRVLKEKGLHREDVHIICVEMAPVPKRQRPQAVRLIDRICGTNKK